MQDNKNLTEQSKKRFINPLDQVREQFKNLNQLTKGMQLLPILKSSGMSNENSKAFEEVGRELLELENRKPINIKELIKEVVAELGQPNQSTPPQGIEGLTNQINQIKDFSRALYGETKESNETLTPTPPPPAEEKINNRTIEKNKKYLEITTMYYTLRDEGKRVNESKNQTMTKSKISMDTFKRALQANKEILCTKQLKNDFKWLI